MKLPKYEMEAEDSLNVFEFMSVGTKGNIPKLIKFSETALKGFYNLAFGDKNSMTGEIDDTAVSNNGIAKKFWQQLFQLFMLSQIKKKRHGFMPQEALHQEQDFIKLELRNT